MMNVWMNEKDKKTKMEISAFALHIYVCLSVAVYDSVKLLGGAKIFH